MSVTPITKKAPKPPVSKTYDYLVEYLRDVVGNKIAKDITTNTIMVTAKLPWDEEELDNESEEYYPETHNIYVRPLKDADILMVKKTISQRKKLEFSKHDINDAIHYLANLRTINPIASYLDSLKWDDKPRLETWLLDYCDAYGPSQSIIKKISLKFMIGMVKRGLNPGAKMDYMLILQGKQGIGKSTLCRILAGRDQFYSEEIPRFNDSRTIIETYSGKLLVEVGEMANFSTTTQIEALKQFITKQVDQARPAFAMLAVAMPRTFSLVGTTNDKSFIVDTTGWRRYWPVCIRMVDFNGLKSIAEQLLAEATFYARHDTYQIHLTTEEEQEYDLFRTTRVKVGSEKVSDTIRAEFENIKELSSILETRNGEIRAITTTTIKNLLSEKFDDSKITSQEIGKVMTSLGFGKYRTEDNRWWIIPETLAEEEEDFEG